MSPWFVAMLSMALVSPALWQGRQVDDRIHQLTLLGHHPFSDTLQAQWDLYNNLGGRARTARMMDTGMVHWWTLRDVRMAWWRPISGLTHLVDYRLWPRSPLLMHAQSILWYGGLVTTVAMIYARIMGFGMAAAIASLLYAMDDAHGLPTGWLASRNSLVGAMFGMLALLAHDRWRRDGWRVGAALAPFCLGLALLSAESAAASFGYILAHLIFLDRGSKSRRLLALLPHGLVLFLWLFVYAELGRGVRGTAPVYVSPISEPLGFARMMVERSPVLLLLQWLPSLANWDGVSAGVSWIIAVASLTLLGLVLFRPLSHDAVARFWVLGQVLAALPAAASSPSRRQLFFIGLGAMGLLAQFFSSLVNQTKLRGAHVTWKVAVIALAIVLAGDHLVRAPTELLRSSRGPWQLDALIRKVAHSIPNDSEIAHQDVVLINAPNVFASGYALVYRATDGLAIPMSLRNLVPNRSTIEVSRPDARTLTVRAGAGYIQPAIDRVLRGEGFPMRQGERVDLPRLSVQVLSVTPDGRPTEAMFQFPVELEDRTLRWLRWDDGHGYVAFTPPAVGATVRLE